MFDEAWYLQPVRPPMAQLLYDMGMEDESLFAMAPPLQPRPISSWPPLPTKLPPQLPSYTKQAPIPLRLTKAPMITPNAAAAAKTNNPYYNTALDLEVNHQLSIIDDMKLDKDEVFAQVYLSPSPYFEVFEEEINIRMWSPNDHHTAGFVFIQRNESLILADILRSTPAAKIDKWRSRCRDATVLEVEGIPVQTTKDVHDVLINLKRQDFTKCRIMMAHPEVKGVLTSQGIPQLHIDQLNT